MRKWLLFFLFSFAFGNMQLKDIKAQEGVIFFDCGRDVVEFPSYSYFTSPFLQTKLDEAPKEYEFKALKVDADPGYLNIIRHLMSYLHIAARNNQGKEELYAEINRDTIFVSDLVKQKLVGELMNEVMLFHKNTKKGLVSHVFSRTGTGSASSPRPEFGTPKSPRKMESKLPKAESFRQQFSKLKDTGKRSLSITHNKPLVPKLHIPEALQSEGPCSSRSNRGDYPASPRHFEEGVNHILGGLYRLSLHFKFEPLTNLLAAVIIERMLEKEKNPSECLQEVLASQGFGSFLENDKYLKKHFALRQLEKEDFTVADYLAKHGQPRLAKFKTLDLRNSGLTSIKGLHLIKHPKKIRRILLNDNALLGCDLEDFPSEPFKRFSNLKILCLNNNNLTVLPRDLLSGVNLDHLELQNNYLEAYKLKKFPGTEKLSRYSFFYKSQKPLWSQSFIS